MSRPARWLSEAWVISITEDRTSYMFAMTQNLGYFQGSLSGTKCLT